MILTAKLPRPQTEKAPKRRRKMYQPRASNGLHLCVVFCEQFCRLEALVNSSRYNYTTLDFPIHGKQVTVPIPLTPQPAAGEDGEEPLKP